VSVDKWDAVTRTIAVGLDGCSWNVLEPLLESGFLPHLSELRSAGAFGVLESTIPFYTGPAWASYATGCSPAAHGVYDFMMLRDGDELSVADAADLQRATYYELLAREGKRSVLVNLPLDQDGCEGAVIVNSWLTVDELRRIFPVDRRSRYRDALAAYRSYPTTFEASLDVHLDDLCGLEEARFALAKELFLGEDWDHFFLLFSSTDWLGHAATGHFLDGDPGARAAFGRLYGQLDGYVGWLRERAPDATVVVLSDHGQCEETHVVHVNGVLRELGLVRLIRERPGNVASELAGGELKGTIRVPVGLRRLRSNPLLRRGTRFTRRALRRAVGVELLTPERGLEVDRVLSRAFTPTIASYAVYTRSCDESVLSRLRAALAGLRLDDGRSAFDGIWTLEELYGRVPTPPAPTFVFAPSLGVRPSIRVRSPFVERARARGRGAHQRDGVLIAAGPDVRPGELGRSALTDISPTLLWLMGEPVPADADGRVLFEAFAHDAVASRELREVDSAAADRAVRRDWDSDDVERRLRDLGYL
jgi:predicted AlkP superfamily phosphohydrolase/phosphomutase